MITELSEQTRRSIDGHRDEFAKIRGVSRNAVDQLMAGNVKDAYVAFREFYQQQLWAGCEVWHYLDDMEAMRHQASGRRSGGLNLAESLIEKLNCDARLGSAMVEAVADGMTRHEAREVLECLEAVRKVQERWRLAAVKALAAPDDVVPHAEARANGNRRAS